MNFGNRIFAKRTPGRQKIPGLATNGTTDLPVMKPFVVGQSVNCASALRFSHWLVSRQAGLMLLVWVLLCSLPLVLHAQSNYTAADAIGAFWRWLPLLVTKGFALNVLISFFTMLIGTVLGILLGLMQVSPIRLINWPAKFLTQVFRNSPWLVLLFIVMLTLPFEIVIGSYRWLIPDWYKAVFGLSLPIMANLSEIVRGAVASVPSGQWEAAESLAFTRQQTLWQIILPQCFKRMIPPWMNWYAILTMATPLVSLLGVEEIITLSRQAMEAEDNHPELLIPFFGFALIIFFVYCYPIARATIALERRYAVKL